ncbi:hypothetical protein MGG_16571 [Pyricularia oryzae 70-15]|uniref:Uncharacterized protein n=1 Tax=Pyricularia oryzae (strain 70-15 / ATCC MYA-4617 / FGSC 8958) TaxID=242507 RepID=G4MLW9_PYRO7|nr:uncharacterized protein MGG_16571 [Pyricularia oryzae 70-15]EHA58536.1 hypothetical protein MGG_16571 [Pyricularia oryzae 70-15]
MVGPYGQIMAQQGSWQTQFLGLLSRYLRHQSFSIFEKNGSKDRAGTAIYGLLNLRVWVRRSGEAGLGQLVSPVTARVRILLPPPPPRLPVARITRLAIDNNHPPVPSSPHLLGTSSPWLQTTDSSAVWTQAPLDEEPSTAVRRILRAPEGTGSRQ